LGLLVQLAERPRLQVVGSGPGFFVLAVESDGLEEHRFRCFPDTIDPRGPKAK